LLCTSRSRIALPSRSIMPKGFGPTGWRARSTARGSSTETGTPTKCACSCRDETGAETTRLLPRSFDPRVVLPRRHRRPRPEGRSPCPGLRCCSGLKRRWQARFARYCRESGDVVDVAAARGPTGVGAPAQRFFGGGGGALRGGDAAIFCVAGAGVFCGVAAAALSAPGTVSLVAPVAGPLAVAAVSIPAVVFVGGRAPSATADEGREKPRAGASLAWSTALECGTWAAV